MHPDICYLIMLDRTAALREEAANDRRASRLRRQSHNPIRRVTRAVVSRSAALIWS
jgi:hypothetical protein